MTDTNAALRGQRSYHAGLSAENAIARRYERDGYRILHTRWRKARGEIDLIVRNETGLVFVEVKKSVSFAQAASRLSDQQMSRIYAAAEAFLAQYPEVPLLDARFDVVLVNGAGEYEIIRNAFGQF